MSPAQACYRNVEYFGAKYAPHGGETKLRQTKHDLNLIRVLIAIADTRRVAPAARALGLTQSGVSNALRRLRATYMDALFVPTPNGMQATPRALPLISAGREILDLYRAKMLTQDTFDPQTSSAEFCFAMSDVGEMVFLPKIIAHFQKHAPHAVIRSMSLPARDLPGALERGNVDLAIGYFPDLAGASLFQQKLFSHNFVCLLRADHPLAGRPLTRKNFCSLKHAVVHAEGRSQEVFEGYLRKIRIERQVVLRVPHFMSIPFVIAKTDLIVTVPLALGAIYASQGGLAVLKPPLQAPSFDLKQHWHRRINGDPRSRWLRVQIARLFSRSEHLWSGLQIS